MKKLFLLCSLVTCGQITQLDAKIFRTQQAEIAQRIENAEIAKTIENLDQRRKTFKRRGSIFVASGTVVSGAGLALTAVGVSGRGLEGAILFLAFVPVGAILVTGGVCMLVKGICHLSSASAHKKLIRRLRMKEEALERKRQRDAFSTNNS